VQGVLGGKYMALKFFHLQKAKQFNIPYRYYDPSKEDRDDRERRMKEEMGIFDDHDPDKPFKANVKGQFRHSMGRSSKTVEDAKRSSNFRLLILIVILSLVVYLVFIR
jgi:hypothetical protein